MGRWGVVELGRLPAMILLYIVIIAVGFYFILRPLIGWRAPGDDVSSRGKARSYTPFEAVNVALIWPCIEEISCRGVLLPLLAVLTASAGGPSFQSVFEAWAIHAGLFVFGHVPVIIKHGLERLWDAMIVATICGWVWILLGPWPEVTWLCPHGLKLLITVLAFHVVFNSIRVLGAGPVPATAMGIAVMALTHHLASSLGT